MRQSRLNNSSSNRPLTAVNAGQATLKNRLNKTNNVRISTAKNNKSSINLTINSNY